MERFKHLYSKGTMSDIFEKSDYTDYPLIIAESKTKVVFLVSRSFEMFFMEVDKKTLEFNKDTDFLITVQYTHNFMDAKSILLNKGFVIDWSVYNYYLRCYNDWFKNPSFNVYIFE